MFVTPGRRALEARHLLLHAYGIFGSSVMRVFYQYYVADATGHLAAKCRQARNIGRKINLTYKPESRRDVTAKR